MTNKEYAIKCVMQDHGNAADNLYRAEHAFRGHSQEQLDSLYGQSNETERQILDGYRAWKDRAKEALDWLRNVGNSA